MASAWSNFVGEVERARDALRFESGEECFYRGHQESHWTLLPTLLRHCHDAGIKDAAEIRNLESKLYFEFRARARDLLGASPSHWDIMFSMRHHGLATRLLDWTETFGVALYFATRNLSAQSTPCIWLLNPYKLNKKSWGIRDLVAPEYLLEDELEYGDYLVDFSTSAGFEWDEPVALYPEQRNARIHAQRGYFTIHGEKVQPLEKLAKNAVKCVPMPIAARDGAKLFLEGAGIDEFLLFPDLDGLTRHLTVKHLGKTMEQGTGG